jgi:hypothetical protein
MPAMKVSQLHARHRECPGAASGRAAADTSATLDAAWLVLEAANDLGDLATVEACRRMRRDGDFPRGHAGNQCHRDLPIETDRCE